MRDFRNKLNTTYKNINNTFRSANLPPHTADWTIKINDFDDLPLLNKSPRPKVSFYFYDEMTNFVTQTPTVYGKQKIESNVPST